VCPDEFYQDTMKLVGDMDNQAVLVATDVENDAIVADKINRCGAYSAASA
jgi:hypothetical protein